MTGSRFPRWPEPVPAVFALVLGALSAGLPGQEAQLDREVRFVRSLARDLRFISLAQAEADHLQEEYKAAASADKLAQLGIEISLWGAKANPNRATQRTLYKEALERSKELIARTSDATVARDARMTLADSCQEFGTFLIEELEIARTENPDHVKELEEEAADVFRAGVDACEKVMDDLEGEIRSGASDAEKRQKQLDYNLTWLRKGILLREHGRAVRADRGYLCERAKGTLEELILEVGEETALGLRGLFEYAQCDQVLGNMRQASILYEDTIEQIATSLRDEENVLDLPAETQQFLFNMMQEIYDHLARLLFDTGEIAKLQALFESFRSHLKEFGQEGLPPFEVADPRFGHSVFLTEARVMAESGDPAKVQEALATAQRINEHPTHASDFVGVRAKRVIKDILEVQQKLVSGKLLFEVAKGEYQNKNYEAAIKGMKQALATMTAQELNELALEAYKLMGYSYVLTDRFLEGVLALKEGLERYGSAAGKSAEEVAERLDMATRRLRQVTQGDPFFQGLIDEVSNLVITLGPSGSGNPLFWRQASQYWASGDYARAAQEFAKITPGYLRYELAQSRRAMALERAGDYAAARQAIADYRKWLDTQDAVIEARRTDLQQVREQAIAEIDYAELTILYKEATGAPEANTKKDLTKYPAVIDKLKAFVANHKKDGANFIPRVYDIMGRLHAEMGQLDRAEEAYRTLKTIDPEGVLLPMLGTVIFDSYLTTVENLDKEWRAALAQGKTEEAEKIEQRLEQMRQKLVNLGMEYARNAPQPQYGVLSNTLYQLDLLEDWTRVDEIARKMINLFGDDPEYKDRIDRVVRPKIGEALLGQRQFQQAYDMLVKAEEAYPNLWEVKRLIALALGGWFEFDERGAPVVVPGLDRPIEAYNKYYIEYQPWGLRPEVEKFSLEWYQFHWEAYWFAYRAIPKDDTFRGWAKSLYRIARSIDDFATLKSLGPEGQELWDKFNANRPPL